MYRIWSMSHSVYSPYSVMRSRYFPSQPPHSRQRPSHLVWCGHPSSSLLGVYATTHTKWQTTRPRSRLVPAASIASYPTTQAVGDRRMSRTRDTFFNISFYREASISNQMPCVGVTVIAVDMNSHIKKKGKKRMKKTQGSLVHVCSMAVILDPLFHSTCTTVFSVRFSMTSMSAVEKLGGDGRLTVLRGLLLNYLCSPFSAEVCTVIVGGKKIPSKGHISTQATCKTMEASIPSLALTARIPLKTNP
ncbi:hypothetical protein F5Y15DRAFT_107839 [Xylariaceae sp. FL0016]|nr:hypothetical protein F5Y15DRAFT_107839 [Xylariaceae sp. FL0016]